MQYAPTPRIAREIENDIVLGKGIGYA